MRNHFAFVLVFAVLIIQVGLLIPTNPGAEGSTSDPPFLFMYEDSISAPPEPELNLNPDTDSCYVQYPDSLLPSSFARVFDLYTSDAVVNGYDPFLYPGWSAAQFDTFANAIMDSTFPRVWDYFCIKDSAAAVDSVHYTNGTNTYTQIEIGLYHAWNFRHNQGDPGTNPSYCDTMLSFPESQRAGSADKNIVVYPVNKRSVVGCDLHQNYPLLPPTQAATNGTFAHELQHLADFANKDGSHNSLFSEFLSTAAEYVSGRRWQNSQGMSHLNFGLYPIDGADTPYNFFRLWSAYLLTHFQGDPGDDTDDLLYKALRYIGAGESVPPSSFHGIGKVLAQDFPDSVSGADFSEKVGNLYQQFALARFADDTTFAGGKYGFVTHEACPRNFGWFEWVSTCGERVYWLPPDILIDDEIPTAGLTTLSSWTDEVDTVFVGRERHFGLTPFGSEYFVFRADSTMSGANARPLFLRLTSPGSALPTGYEVRIGYIEYEDADGTLFEQSPRSVTLNVPVSMSGGELATDLEIAEFGDSTGAVVVVASLVQNPVTYAMPPKVSEALPLTISYGTVPDTIRVPFAELSIQDAIDVSSSGDVVLVEGLQLGAAYPDTLHMKSGVRVVGVDVGYGLPILNSASNTYSVIFPNETAPQTTIENFTVRGGALGLVHLRGSGRVLNCALEAPSSTGSFYGIYADSVASAGAILDTRVELDEGIGIYASSTFDGAILQDTVEVADGTGIDLSSGARIDSCSVVVGAGTGVYLHGEGGELTHSTLRLTSGASTDAAAKIGTIAVGDTAFVEWSLLHAPGAIGIDVQSPRGGVTQCTIDSVGTGVQNAGVGAVTKTIVSNCTTAGFTGGDADNCIAYGTSPFGPSDEALGDNCSTDDPLFCGPGEYTLRADSYANRNNGGYAWIGAFPATCLYGTAARSFLINAVLTPVIEVRGDFWIPAGKTMYLQVGASSEGRFSISTHDQESAGLDTSAVEITIEGVMTLYDVDGSWTFESSAASPAKGDWYGIVAKSGGDAHMVNATVSHGQYGIRFESGSQGYVGDCGFSENEIADLRFGGVSVSTTIENSSFSVEGAYSIDMMGDNSAVTIKNNAIVNSGTLNGGIRTGGSSSSAPLIIGNEISGFGSAEGIRVNAGSPEIVKNDITDCKYGIYVGSGSPEIGDPTDSSSDNVLEDNDEGLRATGSGATPVIRNSQFISNGIGVRVLKSATPELGTFSEDGLNSFVGNTTCVNNSTTGTVFAIGNWWGSCVVPSCNSGTVVVNDWKCTQPASSRTPAIGLVDVRAQKMRLLGAWPNPTRGDVQLGFALEDGYGEVGAQVFDVSGRLVRDVHPRNFGSGEGALQWDGRRDDGARVARGIYFVRVNANDKSLGVVRILILR